MIVQTEALQFKADAKLLAFIQKKMDKIDKFFDGIIDAKVVLKLENSGQVKDKIAEVKLRVPGEVLIASATSKKFETAIDEVVPVLRRQLIKYKEQL